MPIASPVPGASGDTVISVSTLNSLARERLEQGFPLLWVAGEVSNLTSAASGHVYFVLKDEAAQVRCVMFRNRAQLLPFRLGNGMRVEARALVTLYEARGDYQLNVESLRGAGIGALYEAFARLRERLAREGLFDAARKRPVPSFPRRVGVVTSMQAAALRDVLAALRRRSPHLPVIVYPVPVQGESAAAQIAAGLDLAGSRGECDVLILARGGGGIEDLWAFNEEVVARAIPRCPIPVVTGIGHETDTTLADFVADQRAATPTAAAEIVSAGYVEARHRLERLAQSLRRGAERQIRARMQRVDLLAGRLAHPGERLRRLILQVEHLGARLQGARRHGLALLFHRTAQAALRLRAARPHVEERSRELDALVYRLHAASGRAMGQRREALARIAVHLEHLSPQATLNRGYAIARNARGEILRSSATLSSGDEMRVQFAQGWAEAQVLRRG